MEILGMSIAIASVVAGVTGVAARNIVGWLKGGREFDVRNSVASGIIAFLIGVPVIVTGFQAAFSGTETIPAEAQLSLFVIQVAGIAGIDALSKGGLKAAIKGSVKSDAIDE